MAFTGPFRDLSACLYCGEDRFDKITKKPRLQFNTIPLGPQLQALKRNYASAKDMNYFNTYIDNIFQKIDANDGFLPVYDDILSGSEFLNAYQKGYVKPDDFVVMFSFDGAQLYKNKESDCWLGQFVIANLAPDARYKIAAVAPAFTIPGPNKPRHIDSFFFTTLAHLSALQKNGFCLWDASKTTVTTSHPFVLLVTADGPALVYFNGLVGHMGFNGCRIRCGVIGRRKPRDKHFYPALLKPLDPVQGCDHEDVDWISIPPKAPPSTAKYLKDLGSVVLARSEREYKAARKTTGIIKPSLSLGLDPRYVLPPSRCFGPDIMHLICLNIPDILIPLWRGSFSRSATDSIANWTWAIFASDSAWNRHGASVAAVTPYLPGSFGRPPRNPALKINSGYKAWEFLMYIYVLGPGLFYNVLPKAYYENLCDLIFGVRILHQHKITMQQLKEASLALTRFALNFELLYYQRRTDRVHFIRQSIHATWHLANEVTRVGPPICCSQWTMERTIGNLVRELRQPSNPYANLAQRSLLRCQVNALKVLIPDLIDPPSPPRGSIDLNDGYILLRRRDNNPGPFSPKQSAALAQYFSLLGLSDQIPPLYAVKWARLRLPNGQVSRSAWVETLKPLSKLRIARNVKFLHDNHTHIGEVQFYFRTKIRGQFVTLALISRYSAPDIELLKLSRGTLWSCIYDAEDALQIVDVKSLVAVVAMVPHAPLSDGKQRFFLAEKPGMDIVTTDGIEEDVSGESDHPSEHTQEFDTPKARSGAPGPFDTPKARSGAPGPFDTLKAFRPGSVATSTSAKVAAPPQTSSPHAVISTKVAAPPGLQTITSPHAHAVIDKVPASADEKAHPSPAESNITLRMNSFRAAVDTAEVTQPSLFIKLKADLQKHSVVLSTSLFLNVDYFPPIVEGFSVSKFISAYGMYFLTPRGSLPLMGLIAGETYAAEFLNNIIWLFYRYVVDMVTSGDAPCAVEPKYLWTGDMANRLLRVGPYKARPDLLLAPVQNQCRLLLDKIAWPWVSGIGEMTTSKGNTVSLEKSAASRAFLMLYTQGDRYRSATIAMNSTDFRVHVFDRSGRVTFGPMSYRFHVLEFITFILTLSFTHYGLDTETMQRRGLTAAEFDRTTRFDITGSPKAFPLKFYSKRSKKDTDAAGTPIGTDGGQVLDVHASAAPFKYQDYYADEDPNPSQATTTSGAATDSRPNADE
ncbi:hypothetical protein H0H92_004107, partial [Tricholoma furcatifolium]